MLAACESSITITPHPTPQIMVVEVTPALSSLGTVFHACAEKQANMGVVVNETPASVIDLEHAALALRWGPPAAPVTSPVYQVGSEELVVIVHPQNPLLSISLADLRAIYTGASSNWPAQGAVGQVQPWSYPRGEDIQAIFDAQVTPVSGQVTYTAPNPAAMREAVAGSPGAIGFLPRRWLDASVKAVPIDGLDTARLRQPVLALSKLEPKGLEKSWLLCLQERLSE